jgi:Tfp pilus assembly protein PilN
MSNILGELPEEVHLTALSVHGDDVKLSGRCLAAPDCAAAIAVIKSSQLTNVREVDVGLSSSSSTETQFEVRAECGNLEGTPAVPGTSRIAKGVMTDPEIPS